MLLLFKTIGWGSHIHPMTSQFYPTCSYTLPLPRRNGSRTERKWIKSKFKKVNINLNLIKLKMLINPNWRLSKDHNLWSLCIHSTAHFSRCIVCSCKPHSNGINYKKLPCNDSDHYLSFYLQGLLVTHLMVTLFCTFLGLLLMRHCMSSFYKSFFFLMSESY